MIDSLKIRTIVFTSMRKLVVTQRMVRLKEILSKPLTMQCLVRNMARPLNGNQIIHLPGTFSIEHFKG